jgi:Domain of unknown function (DUF4382)
MSQKTIILLAVVIVVLGAAVFYFSSNNSATLASQGKAIIGIADASAAIPGVTAIMITVDTVEVQSGANGWITVSSGAKQYDLLQLQQTGAIALLADANLPVGTYDQIRLTISKVLVTASGTTHEAKLPSGTLRIVGRLVIEAGKTATAVLDFNAAKSLLETGNGTFILAPVVNLETKSDATVEEQSDNTLTISSGTVESDVNVGMDEHGDVKDNFQLDTNAKIEVDAEGVIHVTTTTQNEGGDQKKGKTPSGN